MNSSIIQRKRKRRRYRGYTQRTWSIKGQAYTEIESRGGFGTSVNSDGTVIVYASVNSSNIPFLNIGRWNNISSSWNYTIINLSESLTGSYNEILTSISDDGNVVVVGVEGSVGGWEPYATTGNVYAYEWNGSAWLQKGDAIFVFTTQLSIDISGDGTALAIGEPHFNGNISAEEARVRVFKWAGSGFWYVPSNVITYNNNTPAGQIFGWKVSLNGSGDTIAVGTRSVDRGVSVYKLTGSVWNQIRSNTDGGSLDGSDAIKLDSSGNFIAIAGYVDQNTTTGIVRVYRWTGSTWIQVGNDIYQRGKYNIGEPDVSLSMDGAALRIIVGTRSTDFEQQSGDEDIKVYDWSGTGWELSATVTHGATNSMNGFYPKLSRDGQTMVFGAPNTKTSATYTTE